MTKRTRIEIATLLEVDEGFVRELAEHEIVRADDEGFYDEGACERVRISWSMHHALGVNLAGIEVALHLLDRLHAERRRTRELVQRLRDELDRE
ncbi:MAG: hypothetical protein IT378_03085 [Sandaracinaceae bacterium]|nr:hypothetical protein [Sandaracinaceae bacterium]